MAIVPTPSDTQHGLPHAPFLPFRDFFGAGNSPVGEAREGGDDVLLRVALKKRGDDTFIGTSDDASAAPPVEPPSTSVSIGIGVPPLPPAHQKPPVHYQVPLKKYLVHTSFSSHCYLWCTSKNNCKLVEQRFSTDSTPPGLLFPPG